MLQFPIYSIPCYICLVFLTNHLAWLPVSTTMPSSSHSFIRQTCIKVEGPVRGARDIVEKMIMCPLPSCTSQSRRKYVCNHLQQSLHRMPRVIVGPYDNTLRRDVAPSRNQGNISTDTRLAKRREDASGRGAVWVEAQSLEGSLASSKN